MNVLNSISGQIVFSSLQIHMKLGPGLLEHVYETILARELVRAGLKVERQKALSFDYEGLWFEDVCRVDLMVENSVLVEVKSTRRVTDIHEKQLLTYLRITGRKLGLIVNFGAALLKDGLKRIVNGL